MAFMAVVIPPRSTAALGLEAIRFGEQTVQGALHGGTVAVNGKP